MGCIGSKEAQIKKPYVTREPVDPKGSPDLDNLPFGALLTGAKKLHDEGLTGKDVRVAVIDSGIDENHSGFGGMVKKKEWYRHGRSLAEDDHGTHVAGTIHFMAPAAELYDYRVFGKTGKVGVTEAIRLAILEAIKDDCHVINMSLGGPTPSPGIEKAIKEATSKGIVCVCAAGNGGDGDPLTNEISYPASFPECLSIAAVSKKDGFPVARFSNSNFEVDYSGIGVDVISMKPFGGFQKMSGTSMACPHVAGFVAAIMTNDKKSVRDRLTKEHTRDIGVKGKDNSTGLGFVTYLDENELVEKFGEIGVTVKGKSRAQVH